VIACVSSLQAHPPTVDPAYGMKPAAIKKVARKSEPTAQWIWASRTSDIQTIYARKTFQLERDPRNAFLYVTADNLFTAWINGHRLGSTPPSTDDLAWTRPQHYSLTPYLHSGKNVLAIEGVNQGGAAGILAMLRANESCILVTDGSWRVLDAPIAPLSWKSQAFDDSSWRKATVIAPYGKGVWGDNVQGWPGAGETVSFLAHMPIPPVKVTPLIGAESISGAQSLVGSKRGDTILKPNSSRKNAKCVLLLDFGKELAGRVQVWGTAGAQVILTTGESLQECNHQEPALDNHGPFTLLLQGSQPASTPYTAFRYAEISYTGAAPIRITKAICDFKYYPVEYKGSFSCSDPLLTRLWYAGAYTAHLCMQEYIWDAPKRDRGLWIGDMQVTGQSINNAFGDHFLLERSISEVRDQAQGGRPYNELPVSEVNSIPGYSAAWFCTLSDFYLHSGDKSFLKRQHAKIVSLLRYLQTDFDRQYLFDNPRKTWDFCDWSPGFITDSPLARATTDMYIIWGVRKAVYLLDQLGDQSNAARFTAWEKRLVQAARANFFNSQTNTFGDRLQENVMSILSDTATTAQSPLIYEKIIKPGGIAWVVPHGVTLADSEVMSPYYGYFVLLTMGKLHEDQDALNLLRSYWGNMLSRGTTTLWEMFDPSWPRNFTWVIDRLPYLSLCHGWSSGPTSFLSQRILGVRPTAPGYADMVIQPNLCDLQWAMGSVPTPHGVVYVKAMRTKGRIKVRVSIPSGVHAKIILPGASRSVRRKGDYSLVSK